jgi:uncharacterized protein (DUF58 family)
MATTGGSSSLGALVPADLGELLRTRVLRVRRPVWGRRHGRHAARRVGLGLDFRDHRAYVAGDDPRQLDWRAVARRDRLVLRQTEAEDELSLVAVLDAGANMGYGAGPHGKLAVAKALVAAFAWTAIRQGDRVGLVLAGGGRADTSLARPAAGGDRLETIARSLGRTEAVGRAPLGAVLASVAPRLSPRSVVIVVSDVLDAANVVDDADAAQSELLGGLAQLRARGHDVVLLQTLHRDELEFPWTGARLLKFVDPRGLRVDIEGAAGSLRARYLERMRAHLAALDSACEAQGVMLVRIATDAPLGAAFADLLGRLAGDPHAMAVAT